MNSHLLSKNLAFLVKKDRVLAETLKTFRPSDRYIVTPSKIGPPGLTLTYPDGKRKTLHSSYDPVKEAVRLIDAASVDGVSNFIILGMGLGYHIQELLKRVPDTSRVLVVEKEIEIVYHCLMNNDFTTVLDHPGVQLQIGADGSTLLGMNEEDKFGFALYGYSTLQFLPLVNSDPGFYSHRLETIKAEFHESQVELNTRAAFSKVFYRNIFKNWKNLLNSPGIHSLKGMFQNIPAVIVSAGPSLDKNISVLKGSSQRAVVISVATALKPLLKSGIEVDFVIAIDPEESTIQFFNFENQMKNICLVFDPCVPSSVVDLFPDKKVKIDSGVCLSHWIASKVGEDNYLGKTLSVAHTAFLFARHLGCDPVIFAGQDLSFNRNQLHCGGSYFDQLRKDKIGASQPLNQLEGKRYFEYSSSFKSTRDIFGNEIMTTFALDVYKNIFVENIDDNVAIFNASEGGIDIPGVPNMTLREALNVHCSRNLGPQQIKIPKGLNGLNGFGKIKNELDEQSKRFEEIHQKVQILRSRYIHSGEETKNHKTEFIGAMERLLKFLLDQPETLELMQGYSYSGFIDWNRQNAKIVILEETFPDTDVLEDKFQRDKKFLDVLEEAAEALKNGFDQMADETN